MKLPIGKIARFALNRVVLPAIAKAVVSRTNPLTKTAVKEALDDAVRREIERRTR